MVCSSCSLDNIASSAYCARCNAALTPTTEEFRRQGVPPDGYPHLPAGHGGYPSTAGDEPTAAFPTTTGGFPPPTRPAPTKRPAGQLAIAIGAIVLLLVAGGITAYLFLGTGGARPTPMTRAAPSENLGDPSARVQAGALDDLLVQSGASRRKLNRGIDLVNQCKLLARAVADLQEVGTERLAQIDTVAKMDLSALDNAERLRSTLTNALQNSLAADASYVEWAKEAASNGCRDTAARRTAYATGTQRSTAAQGFKRSFLAVWNPVAATNGLDQRTIRDI